MTRRRTARERRKLAQDIAGLLMIVGSVIVTGIVVLYAIAYDAQPRYPLNLSAHEESV